MTVYYVQDLAKKAAQNEQTGFYTPGYMEEMVSRLGAPAAALDLNALPAAAPAADDVVLVGADTLTAGQAAALAAAAARGTLVVGFATLGAEELFGCRVTETLPQADPFETIGTFTADNALLHILDAAPGLPVLSAVLGTAGGTSAATLQVGDRTLPGLIVTENTCYFPFDLPETLLKIAQGRPMPFGPSDYFPVHRTPDSRALTYEYDSTVPAVDMYLLLLEKLLWQRGMPLLHVLPPLADGTPADLLFYYGGDDDNTSAELDERASQIMHEKGLPYHMNLMPGSDQGDYTLTKADFDRITARGHELALHYNLTGGYTKEAFDNQMQTYMDLYQVKPVVNVAHCLAQGGWAEYARWQAAWGVKGDNGRSGFNNPGDINAFNLYDFGFGTAFPAFVYDDAAHGGGRIDFCSIPLSYYEPRVGGQYGDGEKMQKCVNNAVFYGQAVNLFSHPHYVAFWNGYDSLMTLQAFDLALNLCRQKGVRPYLAGVDAWCAWWHARSHCRLAGAGQNALTVTLADDAAVVVKFPAMGQQTAFMLDGAPVQATVKEIGGLSYALVVVSGVGEHTIAAR